MSQPRDSMPAPPAPSCQFCTGFETITKKRFLVVNRFFVKLFNTIVTLKLFKLIRSFSGLLYPVCSCPSMQRSSKTNSEFVLQGNVVTQSRCGGWKNIKFTRHKFLLVTEKEWLKSVRNYRSYPKNETGYPIFWNTLYIMLSLCLRSTWNQMEGVTEAMFLWTKNALMLKCVLLDCRCEVGQSSSQFISLALPSSSCLTDCHC